MKPSTNQNLVAEIRSLQRRIAKLRTIQRLRATVRTLENRLAGQEVKHPEIETIETIILEHFKVSHDQLIGRDRHEPIALYRHIFCWLLRRYTRARSNVIGAFLRRDHSSVLKSVSAADDRSVTDGKFAADLYALEVKVRAALANGESGLASGVSGVPRAERPEPRPTPPKK